jgi:hypothetical protein
MEKQTRLLSKPFPDSRAIPNTIPSMHDVFLLVADFGSEPDTCRSAPLPHYQLPSFLAQSHSRRGSPFFWGVAQPSTSVYLPYFQIHSLHNSKSHLIHE